MHVTRGIAVFAIFLAFSNLNAAETADYRDYRRTPIKQPAAKLPAAKARPPVRPRQKPSEIYESYQNDPDLKDIEVSESEDSPTSSGPSLKYSQTHIFAGPALLRGNWAADPSNTAMAYFGVGQFIYRNPFYLNLNVTSLVSFSTPKNFMLSGNIGGGLILGSQHVLPFLGFEAGAARIVVSGKGNGFGFKLSPEIGFFPLKIKDHPVYIKAQYNWMALRIADRIPSWYALVVGVAL